MDFPPVNNLITATFDSLAAKQREKGVAPPKAPQPVSPGQELKEGTGLGLNAAGTSGTNRVGTVLKAIA